MERANPARADHPLVSLVPFPGDLGGTRSIQGCPGQGAEHTNLLKPLHWAVGWQNPAQMDVQGRVGSRNQHSSSAWHEFSSAEELNGFRLRLISLSWSKTEAGLLEFLLLPCHYTAESQELSKDMNNICPYLIQPAADNCLSPFPSVHELHQRPWSHHTEFRQICSCRATLQIRTSLCLKWRKREEIAASTKKKKLPREFFLGHSKERMLEIVLTLVTLQMLRSWG